MNFDFKVIGEELVLFIQFFHSIASFLRPVGWDAADCGYFLGCVEIELHQDAGGAEQAQGEHIGLIFCFRLYSYIFNGCIFCVGLNVTEEYVTQLVGYGKSGIDNVVQIVIHDYPLVAVVECFCVFIGQKYFQVAVFLYVNIALTRDLQHVNGQAVNIIVEQALPGGVSDVCVNFVIHIFGRLQKIFVCVGGVFNFFPFFSRDLCDRVLAV